MLIDATSIKYPTIDAWRDFVAQTFLPLEIKVNSTAPFVYTAVNEQIGDLSVTELHINSTTVTRTSALAERSEKAFYKASLQLSGNSEIIQNNKTALLTAGQWAIYDTTQPYTVNVGDDAHFLVLLINPDLLSVWQPYLHDAIARRFDTAQGCGYLIFQMLNAVLAQRGNLSKLSAKGASNAILQLIGAQLSEVLGQHNSSDPASVHQAQLLKIQYYIEQNLHSSDLTIEHLCQVFRCSRRYLYNLFAHQNLAPADYIQRQRLQSSCQRLLDPSYRRPIAELAYQHGFKDATAFSHAFRRRYGLSPTAWRQKQLQLSAMVS